MSGVSVVFDIPLPRRQDVCLTEHARECIQYAGSLEPYSDLRCVIAARKLASVSGFIL